MASTPSILTDLHAELAIDASVLINLLGTGEPIAILTALERRVVIATAAHVEVRRDPFSGESAVEVLRDLERRGLIVRQELDSVSKAHMVTLTAAPNPDDLDDGEAATIALAARMGCCVVIDEARGRRIASAVPIAAGVLNTLDILSCRKVRELLGTDRLKSAVTASGLRARMRIPEEFGPWVEGVIGEESARALPGLRRYYRTRGG